MSKKQDIMNLLQQGICENISFTKADGSQVTNTRGTLSNNFIPTDQQGKNPQQNQSGEQSGSGGNQNNVAYYDLNTNSWRTFNIESLQGMPQLAQQQQQSSQQ